MRLGPLLFHPPTRIGDALARSSGGLTAHAQHPNNSKTSTSRRTANSPSSFPTDDESGRNDLKNFLDQCQAEFTYLMITPANPIRLGSHPCRSWRICGREKHLVSLLGSSSLTHHSSRSGLSRTISESSVLTKLGQLRLRISKCCCSNSSSRW